MKVPTARYPQAIDAVQQAIDHAERRCKENGSRLTKKRKLALSLLLKSGKALSAYELVETYKTELGDTLPAMSMYRILEFLMAENLVHRLDLINKYVACEHIKSEQEHAQTQFLICGQCHKVKEVTISASVMDALKKNTCDAGFHLASPQLEMNCICEACMATGI
ncbi:MAG: transcriptional repressor [Cyanobacteria bacterium P01_F01_bin.150]